MTESNRINVAKLAGNTHRTFYAERYVINAEIVWEYRTSATTAATVKLFFTNTGDTEATKTGTVIVNFDVAKNDYQKDLVIMQNVSTVSYAEQPQYAWVDASQTKDLTKQLAVLRKVSPPEELKQAYIDLSNAVELYGCLQEVLTKIKAMFYSEED